MATFAPNLPDMPVPDWTKTSHPTSQPESDKSKGIVLSTIGEGIQGAATIAETGAEDYLKEKVRAGVDTLRDTTTLAYEDIRKSQVQGTAPDPQAAKTAGFTGKLTSDGPDIPDGLQSGLDKATTLSLAKAQGKANDTLYTGALNAMAKQLRSQYPGHRDFIDEQISRISGINPANAYMQNLLVDINRASTGQDQFQKMVLQKADANMGNPEVQKWLVATHTGVPNGFAGLTNAVFQVESQKYQHQLWQNQNEETKGDLSADADLAKNQYEIRAQQVVSSHLNPILDIPGLTKPDTMGRLIQDSQEGKLQLSSEQHNQLLSAMVAARNQAADHLQNVSNSEGYSSRIRNPADVSAIGNRQLEYFDRQIDAIKNKDYGTLFEAKRRADAMQDQTRLQANTSNIGEWLRQRKVFQDYLGPQWNNYLDSIGLKDNKLQELQSFVSDSKYRASLSDDVRKDGYVKSLYSDLQAAKTAKARGIKAPDAVYDSLVDNVNLILKANEGGKTNIAKEVVDYTFDPTKNGKVMNFFNRDFTDDKGMVHKGRFAVYDILTAPKVVDAVNKIGDKDSWNKMKDWQELSFKSLFQEDVKTLDQMGQTGNVKITWDSDNHRIGVESAGKGSLPQTASEAALSNGPYQQQAFKAVKDTVDRLNKGLGNLSYMHSKDGSDTNEYLFDTLMQMGYTPNDKLHGDNLPQKVIEAIKASQEKPKTPEERIQETFKRARGD